MRRSCFVTARWACALRHHTTQLHPCGLIPPYDQVNTSILIEIGERDLLGASQRRQQHVAITLLVNETERSVIEEHTKRPVGVVRQTNQRVDLTRERS